MNDKVKENTKDIKALKTDSSTFKKQIYDLQSYTSEIAAKLEDLEGRSRRNNIRIIGVPEKAEGLATDLFVEKLIVEGLHPRGLSKIFSNERAHRVPGVPPKPGTPPRTIIAKLFNFRDRDVILQVARSAPPVKIDNAQVRFFPDFTLQVERARRGFNEVKAALRNEGLQYSMMFPARLRVEKNGKTWYFGSPAAAWSGLKGNQLERLPTTHNEPKRCGNNNSEVPLGRLGGGPGCRVPHRG